jgi:DNA-binding CsgD family transcriptional regulator
VRKERKPAFSSYTQIELPLTQDTVGQQLELPLSFFSSRQLEIMSLVAEGLNARAIGRRLFISPLTVKDHLGHVRRMLDVASTATAILETESVLSNGMGFGRNRHLVSKLSPRQRQVVELIVDSNGTISNKEIAAALNIKLGTVKNTLQGVYDKFGVRTRLAAGVIFQQSSLAS